jgi:hypothetical protein
MEESGAISLAARQQVSDCPIRRREVAGTHPYGEGEGFPRTRAHEAWRAEWNTREARRWILPLAPRAIDEWARAAAGIGAK